MDWLPLPTIEPVDRTAKNLAQQVADLQTFRAEAVSDKPPVGRFYIGEEAVNEALRRELILRLDIARYLASKGRDPAPEKAASAQVRQILDDRDGHRS
jgi:hypothetical protein